MSHTDGLGRTALHRAACEGHERRLRRLLTENVNMVHVTDQSGCTALHLAAKEGHHKAVEVLATHSPQLIDATDEYGRTALHIAARKGCVSVVEVLIALNSKIEPLDVHGCSALHLAAQEGHAEVVKRLVASNPTSLDAVDGYGRSVLHWAARRGHDRAVAVLVEQHPQLVNAADNYGFTPLHAAALGNHGKILEQLLTCNPKIEISTPTGFTALHFAAQGGFMDMVTLLLAQNSKFADETVKANDCMTTNENMLNDLTITDQLGCVEQKIESNNASEDVVMHTLEDSTSTDTDNNNNQVYKRELLCMVTSRGETALHLAAEKGHEAVAGLLLTHKPQLIFALDGEGNTILHKAAHVCGKDFIETLWSMNLDALHAVNCDSQTPFHLAVKHENKPAVEFLHRKMQFDEVVSVFSPTNYAGRLRPLVEELVELPLQANLIRDVVGTVRGYLLAEMETIELSNDSEEEEKTCCGGY